MQAPAAQVLGGVEGMVTAARPVKMMNLVDSVKTCLQKYVGFEGRASRSEYWWFYLVFFLSSMVAGIADGMVFGMEKTDPTWITIGLRLALLLPLLSSGVRRMHDHGKSGWFILIPFYNLYLLIVEGEAMPNAYGLVPTNVL